MKKDYLSPEVEVVILKLNSEVLVTSGENFIDDNYYEIEPPTNPNFEW